MNTQDSKWQCPVCRSLAVEISLPVWFTESKAGELTQMSTDSEAIPTYWYCNECDETGHGEPDLAEDSI